jgi:hypothetical protein
MGDVKMKKEVRVGSIIMEYCPNCYNYKITHDKNILFHGMKTEYLKNFSNFVIIPRQNPGDLFYKICRYYFYYLKEPKIHLSSLDRAGLENPDYDVHFAFRLENLKTRINSLLYINGNLWDFLAFYDCSEEERRKKRNTAFS